MISLCRCEKRNRCKFDEIARVSQVAKYYIFIIIFISFSCGDLIEPVETFQEYIDWPSLAESSWPIMHGDAQHTGRSSFVGPRLESVHLTVQTPFYLESSPTIDEEGNLYFTTSTDSSFLYKTTPTGERIWRYFLKAGSSGNVSSPTVSSLGTCYVSDGTHIYSITLAGELNWQYLSETNTTAISLDKEGNLYYIQGERNTNNNLVSLTPDGALRWSLSVPGDFRISTDPFTFSTEGDQFYVSGNDSLYAISPSGTMVWAYDAIGWIYTIVDNDDNVYFFHHAFNQFISVNKEGNLNWSIHLADYGITSPNHSLLPTITKDGIIPIIGFTSPGNKMLLVTLDGETVTEVILDEVVSTHLVSDSESHVYFGTSIGHVIKMSSSGSILQTMSLSDSLILIPDNSPSISSDGTMYLSIYDNPFTQIVGVQ